MLHLSLRRDPAPDETACLACLGLIAKGALTTMIVAYAPGHSKPGTAPVPASHPTTLASLHHECLGVVLDGSASIPTLRATPRGPNVDSDGAVLLIHDGVHYRTHGPHRVTVNAAIRDAIRAHGDREHAQPIIAFVRRYLNTSTAAAYIGSFNEVPSPPPSVPAAVAAPRFTLNVYTRDPGQTASAPPPGAPAAPGGYTSQGPPQGDYNPLETAAASGALSKLGGWGKPRGDYGTTSLPPDKSMSPNVGDNSQNLTTQQWPPSPTASGRELPPPGTVADAMLPPLDTPEMLAARPTIAAALRDGLKREHPKVPITTVDIGRDPGTLAEVVTVSLDRRIVDRSTDAIRNAFLKTLRTKVKSWATMEASGIDLVVVDTRPIAQMVEGAETDDEVNMLGLPPNAKPTGLAPQVVGQRVAIVGPLWSVLTGGVANLTGQASLAIGSSAAGGEVNRIRERLQNLIPGIPMGPGQPLPGDARIGKLVGYDVATGHACVHVDFACAASFSPISGAARVSFYVHIHNSWLVVWNVPDEDRFQPPPRFDP